MMKATVKNAQANKPDANGMVYTQECLENMAEHIKHMDISAEGMLGEVQRDEVDKYVTLMNVTHKITNPRITDEALSVDCEILDTPKGKRIQEYLVNQLQFAPRFAGDNLISIDIVR